VDRADIKEYVGNPPPQAIYWILSGCIEELVKRKLASNIRLLEWGQTEKAQADFELSRKDGYSCDEHKVASLKLADIAQKCCVSDPCTRTQKPAYQR
jgi:hypothetical protein